MIDVINDIDKLLDAAPTRYGQAIERQLTLTASARAFDVALDATVTPASIVFIASGPGMTGAVEFTTDNGTLLSVAGNAATLTAAALVGSGVTVTASMTVEGQPYSARQTVIKALAFDASTPAPPSGLATTGTLASIQLTWTPSNNSNLGKVEIWRSLTDNLANAVPIGTTAGLARSYVDTIGAAGAFFYWIRYISKANVAGPFNAQQGTAGASGTDAGHLLDLLVNRVTEAQLLGSLRARIDLVDAAGTGLVDRVDALVDTYGETSSSAASAAQAAEAAADAVQARAQALLAAGASADAAFDANTSRLAAQSANEAAGTAASAASTSASNAASYSDSAGGAAAASNQSKIDAQAASGSAQGSATAAVTARDTAVAKAGEAGTSAQSASTSANTASTKAGEASSSATSAATSASNASTSSNSASTSALNAATYRDNAAGSAQAAAGSASTASTHASSAETSASSANTARVAAESARDAASGSASAASTSASTASTHATNASTSASAANTSASTASTKAGEALAYRNSAAQSEFNAQGHANAAAQDYTAINARLDSVGGTGATVEQRFTATANTLTGLSAQATVKIDIDGYVTGYGLASTPVNGVPYSAFVIRADSFMVVAPGMSAVPMFSVAAGILGFSGKLVGPSGNFGHVTIAAGGSFSSGQPAYNVGTGWYFGFVGGVPVASMGVAGGAGWRWDGTNLHIVNPVIASFTLTITPSVSGTYFTMHRNTVNGGAGVFNASCSGGSGNYAFVWRVEAFSPTEGAVNPITGSQGMPTVSGRGFIGEIDFYLVCTATDTNTGQSKTQTQLFTVDFT